MSIDSMMNKVRPRENLFFFLMSSFHFLLWDFNESHVTPFLNQGCLDLSKITCGSLAFESRLHSTKPTQVSCDPPSSVSSLCFLQAFESQAFAFS
jgi:hypothetical protein